MIPRYTPEHPSLRKLMGEFTLVFTAALVLAVGAVLATQGCAAIQPTQGATCAPGDAVCQPDGKSAIVCSTTGRYTRVGCNGPQGCGFDEGSHKVSCDQTAGALDGELCLAAYAGKSECQGAGQLPYYLTCSGGAWHSARCGGDAGVCDTAGGNVVCR